MLAQFGTLLVAVFYILVCTCSRICLNMFSLERGSGSTVWHTGDDGLNVVYFSISSNVTVRHSGGSVLNVYWQLSLAHW